MTLRTPKAPTGGDMRGPALSLGARVVVAPVVGAALLLAARLVLESLGVDGYAVYALVAGIALLLPFADLGMGAAVMDTVARRSGPGDSGVEDVLVTTIRWLVLVGISLATIGILGAFIGIWGPALGARSHGVNLVVAAVIGVFAMGLPFSVGLRILTGAQLNHWTIIAQAISALLLVGIVAIAAAWVDGLIWFALAPYLSIAIVNVFATFAGLRLLNIPWRRLAGRIIDRRSRGGSVSQVAGPMFLITVVLALAYQSDRFVLSYVSDLGSVASYSVAFQIYAPLTGLIASASISLWPVFAKASGPRITRRRFLQCQIAFGALGSALAASLVLLGPSVNQYVSNGQVNINGEVFGAFGALLVVQSIFYPMAMILTDPPGLRYQAKLYLVMLLVNLPLSFFLALKIGPAGPVLASVLAIILTLIVPPFLRVWRITGSSQLTT